MERWRWIKKFRGFYKVSSYGRVKAVNRYVEGRWGVRLAPGRIIKPRTLHYGHLQVELSKNGRKIQKQVHRLVLEAFVGPCPPGKEARHFPDRNPANNKLENLSWGSHKKNMGDRVIHGTDPSGERSPTAKLTRKKVRKIRRLWKSRKYRQWQLAEKFGVTAPTINCILKNKTWR